MLLELDRIEKTYHTGGDAEPLTVLRDISLRVEMGKSIAVLGPSGSGKSTLLNIMGALDRPSAGTVTFEGKDLAGMNDAELARVRNTGIGFVFQLHHLLPQCTVLENVLVPALPRSSGDVSDETSARARDLLERVGLGKRLDYFPARLSGGERQRTAVVRALINRPTLLLADEPTGSLDQDTAGELGDLLLRLNGEEATALVVVTHSPELAKRMDRVFRLKGGVLQEAPLTGS